MKKLLIILPFLIGVFGLAACKTDHMMGKKDSTEQNMKENNGQSNHSDEKKENGNSMEKDNGKSSNGEEKEDDENSMKDNNGS